MTSPIPTQVHQPVGNDLGGTRRPASGLGWDGLALSEGSSSRKGIQFQQLTQSMGEAERNARAGMTPEVGGPSSNAQAFASVIERDQRAGKSVKQAGGLGINLDPILSRNIGNVVFIIREELGGSD